MIRVYKWFVSTAFPPPPSLCPQDRGHQRKEEEEL